MSKSMEIAKTILDKANSKGWTVLVDENLLILDKRFTPGDLDAYVKADGEYYSIISLLPTSHPGSIWGTTSDGVGGYVGHTHGYYNVKKSGGNKNVLNALVKLLDK